VSDSQQGAISALGRLVAQASELGQGSEGFEPLREGVEIRSLVGNETTGASAALLRYAPGARVPAHKHRGFELIYVVSGSQSDENGTYGAGTLVVNREGGGHSVWSEAGCLVLIVWEHPIEFI
jgi:anti-sigma factor ChrR (cupin superfamily)